MTDLERRLGLLSEQIAGTVLFGPSLIAEAIKEMSRLRQAAQSERERCAAIADVYGFQARPLGDENVGDCPLTAYYDGQRLVAQNIAGDIRNGV